MNLNTSQLPYILTIASTGSLSAAARALEISQPSLSEYLANTEKEAGVPLFIRRKRRLYPTAAGQLYLSAAKDILELMEHTKNSIAQLSGQEKMLRVGTGHHRGAQLLAELYPEMSRVFPRLQIRNWEGFCGDLKQKLRDNEIDIGINSFVGGDATGLDIIPMHNEEIVLAMPEYLVAGEPKCTLEELPYVNLDDYMNNVFILTGKQSALYELADIMFTRLGKRPAEMLTATSITMQIAMIRSGCGIGLVPMDYVRPGAGLSFARVRQIMTQSVAFFLRSGHCCSDVERYFIYLVLRDRIQRMHRSILWNELFREIVWEYDPGLASVLELEKVR